MRASRDKFFAVEFRHTQGQIVDGAKIAVAHSRGQQAHQLTIAADPWRS